jgi:hypothetical protein
VSVGREILCVRFRKKSVGTSGAERAQCGTGTGGSSLVTNVSVVVPTIMAPGFEILECCGSNNNHEGESTEGSRNTHHNA